MPGFGGQLGLPAPGTSSAAVAGGGRPLAGLTSTLQQEMNARQQQAPRPVAPMPEPQQRPSAAHAAQAPGPVANMPGGPMPGGPMLGSPMPGSPMPGSPDAGCPCQPVTSDIQRVCRLPRLAGTGGNSAIY